MSEFDDKLGAILNDSEAMGQIMALAQSLSQPKEGEEPAADCPPEEGGFALPEQGRDVALLAAIQPYLSPTRQKRVDKALELLRMIRLVKGMSPFDSLCGSPPH